MIDWHHFEFLFDISLFFQNDPFKLKNGGLVNMSSLKGGKLNVEDDAYDTGIGTQFSAETNKRDEDDEMYVISTN